MVVAGLGSGPMLPRYFQIGLLNEVKRFEH